MGEILRPLGWDRRLSFGLYHQTEVREISRHGCIGQTLEAGDRDARIQESAGDVEVNRFFGVEHAEGLLRAELLILFGYKRTDVDKVNVLLLGNLPGCLTIVVDTDFDAAVLPDIAGCWRLDLSCPLTRPDSRFDLGNLCNKR